MERPSSRDALYGFSERESFAETRKGALGVVSRATVAHRKTPWWVARGCGLLGG